MNIGISLTRQMASVGLAALTSLGFVLGAHAAETEYSGTFCISSKATVLESNPEVTVYVTKSIGITTPDSSFQPWANATVRCVGYNRIVGGARTATGSCRWVDSSGDFFIGESMDKPGEPGKWTFLAGSGKWKGIQGGGTYKVVAVGKPAEKDTTQLCMSHNGKYTLP